ncbi:MAG: hypothetical protein HQL53_02890 [Magnetococcales bacterium]|nr:hypothetical protein [Magnetococcales bacterium]
MAVQSKNRFTRLVGLRRLEEENKAGLYGQAVVALEGQKERLSALDLETEQARREEQENFGDGRLSPEFYLNFYRGQAERRKMVLSDIERAGQELERARQVWNSARVKMLQAEKLEEKSGEKLRKEAEKQALREMDMVGVIRHQREFLL